MKSLNDTTELKGLVYQLLDVIEGQKTLIANSLGAEVRLIAFNFA